MVLVDALYINNSGGKALLDYLTDQLHASGKDAFYLLDSRVEGRYSFLPVDRVAYLKAGMWRRHGFYIKNHDRFCAVLCFGNIPPSIRLKCSVFTYFHNVLYLDFPSGGNALKRFSYVLKFAVLKLFSSCSDEWWVQTQEVKDMLCRKLKIVESRVRVYPFFPQSGKDDGPVRREQNSFLYVSDANPHKNHERLLEAFKIVHAQRSDAKLYLTVTEAYPAMARKIDTLSAQGIPVINLGKIDRVSLLREYAERACLIYPSLRESFGLGLIEAVQAGMPVLGADLPYTHAVATPIMTFDPYDPGDMARAMLHFLNEGGRPAVLKVKNEMPTILERLSV